MTTLLAAAQPYDGARLLSFLGAHAVAGVESWDGTTYARSVRTSDGGVVVSLTTAPGGIAVDGTEDPAVLRCLEHRLATTVTTGYAEQHLADDVVLAASVALRPGLRPPGSLDHGETLVRTVVGQQVSLKGARAALARVSEALGEPLPTEGRRAGVTTLFPTIAAHGGYAP